MIKATDLRVNNLLEYYISTDNLGWIISEIDWQDIGECQENPISFNVDNRGVKLTEYWLLKFGFEEVFEGKYKRYKIILLDTDIYLRPSLDKWFFGFKNNGEDCEINDCYEMGLVHELQNLIFALTKHELTIKKK
jgi:hypothetical protein